MKINKNSSIFENFIPIEKIIKKSQIYEDISLPRKLNHHSKEEIIVEPLKFISPKMDYGINLPAIRSPASTKSSSRIAYNHRRQMAVHSQTPKDLSTDNLTKSTSPLAIQ